MKKMIVAVMLALCLFCSALLSACGSAELTGISVTKLPQRTEYERGETLDLTGGELTAAYSDNSEKIVSLTDSSVTIQKPNMNTAGEKSVAVVFGSKTATFKITVTEVKLNVTFDPNYESSQKETVKVEPNALVAPPSDPVRTGYVFLGWYVGAEESSRFNFEAGITQDVTVYAHWGYSFLFDLNYDGAQNATEKVEIGASVAEPANPKYAEHLFNGWFTEKDGGEEYDFASAVNANTTVYAGWTKVTEGTAVVTVTFDYQDGTGRTRVREIVGGTTVSEPHAPTIEGATFNGWYKEDGSRFDFSSAVSADTKLLAKWTVAHPTATFHYNHANNNGIYTEYTDLLPQQSIVEPEDPVLTAYYFVGWYKDAGCTIVAGLPERATGFHHYYAKWLREWEFQAEYTDFGDREAFGYSANGTGASAFICKNGADLWGAHNGYWVANLHNKGLYVEFVFNSDAEVFDAILNLRLSADFYDITLNKNNFEIKVNGEVIDYSFEAVITGAVGPDEGGIQNKRPFDNWEFLRNLHLVKGENTIRFTMTDSQRYGEVGTMYATAPMMDSIFVNTNAALSWTPVLNGLI